MKYYIIANHTDANCYVLTGDYYAAPLAFDTEDEAIEEAKAHAPAIVVRTVAELINVAHVKVKKVK